MAIAYFDCFSGISGDMILGALVDAGLDLEILKEELKKLPVDAYRLTQKLVTRQHIAGTKLDIVIRTSAGAEVIEGPNIDISHNHEGPGHHLADLVSVVERSTLKQKIKQQSIDIFEH